MRDRTVSWHSDQPAPQDKTGTVSAIHLLVGIFWTTPSHVSPRANRALSLAFAKVRVYMQFV